MKEHGTTNIFTPLLFSSLFHKGEGTILMPQKKKELYSFKILSPPVFQESKL
jgi:hypothetical protein